jgi:L-ribulokinase
VAAIALDTTGSSVVLVGKGLDPLDDYYLWCDHRAKKEALEITELAHREKLPQIDWCGGAYSAEWGWAKLLHWFRNNPDKRDRFASAFEHCDMVAATLCGITDPKKVKRSICAAGHKWLWHADYGGLPPEEFLVKLDPLLRGVRDKLVSEYATSDVIEGHLTPEWAEKLGLKAGIAIPVGAFDAHWDAIGAGVKEGDVVNVVGTSTCIIAYAGQAKLVPGVCGVVKGSVHPSFTGIEAGLSAVGDVFSAIARRAQTTVAELSKGLDKYHAGQTGMLRFPWDNGDRTVLVNPYVAGIAIGWNLQHTAQDELFAAIEGTAFHTRIILDQMSEFGVRTDRVINGGGVPQNNPMLNQVYANVLGRPVLVPETSVTGLGSGIFAMLAAGAVRSIEEAQARVCLRHTEFLPDPAARGTYDTLYGLFKRIYFDFGNPAGDGKFRDVLPTLIKVARE